MILTKEEETKIINRGRMYCVIFTFVCASIGLYIFKLDFQLNSFWLIKNNNHLTINVPYFGLVVAIIFLIYMHIEPFTLKIQNYDFKINKLNGLVKIAHITDTHIHFPYPNLTENRLIKIMKKINSLEPDIVIFTGDLMSDWSKYAERDIKTITNALQILKSPIYVCFGNHDEQCHDELEAALKEIGVTTLEQQTIEVNVRGTKFYFSGLKPSLDLTETENYVENLANSFNGDKNLPHFLLAHMPDAADAASRTGLFDMQFSGHSHGGQCVLPFNGGTPLLPPGCLKYHACVTNNYRVGDMILHISRGLGVTPLPFPLIRFLCKPEFSMLYLS